MAKDQLQEMLDAAVHFGHKTQKWNPKMKKYIYGVRNGVHIIDVQMTQEGLDKACEFIKGLVSSGKKILLVCTKPQAAALISAAAKETNMPYVINKWVGGLLTNFFTIKKRIRYYKKLRDEEKTGELEKYTKKEIGKIKKTMVKLEAGLGGVRDMDRLPDAVFVVDVVRDHIAVSEANKLKIPVIGIVDTNADPSGTQYSIPGNDDAIKSLTYLINAVKSAMVTKKS